MRYRLPEVQVALLTARINELTGHFKEHMKDHHCAAARWAWSAVVASCSIYLKGRNPDSYRALIENSVCASDRRAGSP